MDEYGAEYDAFSGSAVPQDLSPCHICGRNFNPTVLQRHIPICQKANSKKRKVFDASKQRAEGTDLGTVKPQRHKPASTVRNTTGSRQPNNAHQPPGPSKNNWRAKHADFINTIRAARGVQKAMAEGGPLPPPPPPSINPDYIQCPYCSRRFSQTAAERHINFCKEQQSRLPAKKAISQQSLKREEARKKYAAPKPKPKASPSATSSGYGPARPSPSSRSYGSAQGSASGSSYGSARGGSGGMGGTSTIGSGGGYNASRYGDNSGADSPSSGRMLRTGRNTETYSEARKLSANQRSNMPASSRRTPVSTTGSKYGASSTRGGPEVTGNGYKAPADNGYYSADSTDSHRPSMRAGTAGPAKFCHECGSKYPVQTAKFCCECGIRRTTIS